MNNWINCKKQMPPSGAYTFITETVIVTNGHKIGYGHYDKDRKIWETQFPCEYDSCSNDITYWMPFPKLPK